MNPRPEIFVVDDDDAVREGLALLLGVHGWHTREFASAETFLQTYAGEPCACVISDLQMVGVSGAELIEALATHSVPLPVALLTAYPDHPLAIRALQAGAVAVLRKPVSEGELVATIKLMLDGAGTGACCN